MHEPSKLRTQELLPIICFLLFSAGIRAKRICCYIYLYIFFVFIIYCHRLNLQLVQKLSFFQTAYRTMLIKMWEKFQRRSLLKSIVIWCLFSLSLANMIKQLRHLFKSSKGWLFFFMKITGCHLINVVIQKSIMKSSKSSSKVFGLYAKLKDILYQ